ncbi:MAG TPA: non-ribosomal peptide synthase/polyketide synthase [Chitinophaga sp.]|uniref:non-ribosomal peptide synthase/polyketide synthase n=1 Tax=Chitinophaga sp. TaxID=1869181 RepID=UPI002CD71546|nr:non-ribosomal peptide synthase/polyketide synthase [Chitinophaga sp.]HVI46052.1 non-ribosomal peptide synthase/polyketide synthase [Chitinophaga sp.]
MSIKDFITKLEDTHFSLVVKDEKLILQADRNKLTDEQIAAVKNDTAVISYIRQHKQELIDHLSSRTETTKITAVYRLSSLQEGMLFHGLYDKDAGAYTEQLTCTLTDLHTEAFARSWNYLLQRHTILRSSFDYEGLDVPVQCVYRNVPLHINIEDFSHHTAASLEAAIAAFAAADKAKGFNYKEPPLMRISLLQTAPSTYRMIWTFHHILLDGWSTAVLMEELLQSYEHFAAGKVMPATVQDAYEDYIRYVYARDKEEEEQYWMGYMNGLSAGSVLPFIKAADEHTKGLGEYHTLTLPLDAKVSAQVQSFAKEHGLTINTIMQGIWGYLLHAYTGAADIVYGITVAGRPAGLADVENRVGLYINTLPLRLKMEGDADIAAWLTAIQQQQFRSREYEHTPLHTVKKWAGIQEELFDSLLVFENYPVDKVISSDHWKLKVTDIVLKEQTNYPLTIIITSSGNINITFSYNSTLLEDAFVERIAGHFREVLLQFAASMVSSLKNVNLLTPHEREQLLHAFAGVQTDYPKDSTVTDLYEAQVALAPDAIAVICGSQTLTYRELHMKSGQLAHYLQQQGVTPGTLVPVCMNRSLEMMTAILAVLKAGAAYVPIDPAYPVERIRFMLTDINSTLLLSATALKETLAEKQLFDGPVIYVDEITGRLPDVAHAVTATIKPDDLAYVIYTSGSTGQPKGAMVTHQNIVSLVTGTDYVSLTNQDVILSAGSLSFDATTFEYWGMLLNGGRLVLSVENNLLDTALLKQELYTNGVTTMFFTTSWFNQLVDTDITVFAKLSAILTGGEKLSEKHAGKFRDTYPHISIRNIYGPTENTTFSLSYLMTGNTISASTPIGRPLNNRSAYILDQDGRPAPVGVTGELFVGGAGVARGYLNREELTKERFIDNPFLQGGRLYKTGDLARWTIDGDVEYMGRIDDQVKIRGYRIELGEIENTVLQHEQVKQCVVLAKQDAQGTKRLIGYVVYNGAFNRDQLVEYLQEKLPEYMVPGIWVEVENIPLTANGKADKRLLPDPDVRSLSGSEYVAPRNHTETLLAGIWQDLLGIQRVGIHDNFFRLGGDSIITIQLVSRIRREGLELQVKEVFRFPTVAQLAALIWNRENSGSVPAGEQEVLEGTAGLIPVQQWFFEEEFVDNATINHFNQSVLLSLDKRVDENILSAILHRLQEQHDALRFAYTRTNNTWQQAYSAHFSVLSVEDYTTVPEEYLPAVITSGCNHYQTALDITTGDVIRMVWMKLPADASHNRLFVTVHHLAVDGVSWRIILDDFSNMLEAAVSGKEMPVMMKTASFRAWHGHLAAYSGSPRLLSQVRYWEKAMDASAPLPVDHVCEELVRVKDSRDYRVTLPADLTGQLLKEAHHAYNTGINDLLLAALARTLTVWTKENQIVIGMEGHGRESLGEAVNTDRSVGWFTSMYPVLLHAAEDDASLIIHTKENLRELPDNGLGFGVLKYINRTPSLQHNMPWDIVFNYLGQLDNVTAGNHLLSMASEPAGVDVGAAHLLRNLITVNSMVKDGQLEITWRYSKRHYNASTVTAIADQYLVHLEQLIAHCLTAEQRHTPADFGLAGIVKPEQLDRFLSLPQHRGVSAVYRLNGLQEGMLFHRLYDEGTHAYMEQFICGLDNIDERLLQQSWAYLQKRHSILRTGFDATTLGIPVQFVDDHAALPFTILDYRDKDNAAVEAFLHEDRNRGFDFKTAPLMRVALLRLTADQYRMVWSFHHILLDGWSLPVLVQELLQHYELLAGGGDPGAVEEDRYEDYIRYIDAKDKWKEEAYWRAYLNGLEAGTQLPFIASDATGRTKGAGTYAEHHLLVPADFTNRIKAYAKNGGLTVNTIMQGVWALLLQHYTGRHEAVYGVTVSGRPGDLPEVEQRAGLYINTLPLFTRTAPGMDAAQWLSEIQQSQIASREYEHTPLSLIQQWNGITGDLFDSLLIFENYPIDEVITTRQWKLQLSDITIREQTNYPLNISITATDTIDINFNYNTALLPELYVHQLAGHFRQVLSQLVANEKIKIDEISILTNEERDVLKTFNGSSVSYPAHKSITALFEEQAAATPDATALIFEAQQLSYRELNNRANQLALYMQQQGTGQDARVALCLERSPEMIIAILAVLKLGAAYVPVDPGYPAERITFILEDTGAALVLTTAKHRHKFTQKVIATDDTAIYSGADEMVGVTVSPDSPAYIIYTSGSTGTPKGVVATHRGVVNLVYCQSQQFAIKEDERVLLFSNYCFDPSIEQIFFALLNGAALVLFPEGTQLDPLAFEALLDTQRISHLEATPGFLSTLTPRAYSALKRVLCGGEMCPKELATQWSRYVQFYNVYGPTETTITALACLYTGNATAALSVPVGRPLANVRAYILDGAGKPVPVGVTGELYIGGAGVTSGYLNNDNKTALSFIPDPFSGVAGASMYRTGDLARWLPDGNIEYAGRADEQVKIRGFRVEPGEIENTLRQYGRIDQCVVLAHTEASGNKSLVAYIVAQGTIDKQAVTAYLKEKLPAFMVPAALVELDQLPLTSNGKVDKKTLLALGSGATASGEYVAPRTEKEQILTEIWAELLGIQRVGIYDDFFALGGHSLLVMRFIAALHERFQVSMPVKSVFANPTVAAFAMLLEGSSPTAEIPEIGRKSRPARVPLSYGQERLWFIDRLEGSVHYHLPNVLQLKGNIDKQALEAAFRGIVNRHEVLRTVIREEDGQAYQHVLEPDGWRLSSIGEHISQDEAVRGLLDAPFDLSQDHMLRAALLETGTDEYLLITAMHHIASDGWSGHVLVRELVELYNAHTLHRDPALQPLPVQYADYAIWQRDYLSGEVLSARQQYWKDQLTGVSPLNLPTDYSRPAIQSTAGNIIHYHIPPALQASLQSLSQEQGTTLYMTLMAAFQVLLYRYSGQEDICVGTPVAGRRLQELEHMIGFFVNTLAVRQQVDGSASFTALLQSLKQQLLAAYEHQDLPFERMVEAVSPERDRSRNPLFQVMFILQNQETSGDIRLGDVLLSQEIIAHNVSKFDLTFSLTSQVAGLAMEIEYSTALFREDTIRRMAQHFEVLLQSIISAPQTKIGLLRMTTEEEVTSITKDFNDTAVAYNLDQTFADLFNEQVLRTPEATAVVFENEILSYRELNERSHQLACYLREQGVREEVLVPLCLERSFDMIIGILGILKAGGAYVPVDPHYPEARIRYMLEDTNAPLVLTQQRHAATLKDIFSGSVLSLDELQEEINAAPRHALAPPRPGHLAYVIYTSGSTGKPKGVMNEHRGLLNRLLWTQGYFGLDHTDAVLQKTTFCFDVSVWELLWPLMTGAKLVFAIPGGEKDAAYISDVIAAQQITTIHFVPSMLQVFLEQISTGEGARLRRVLCSGEALQAAHVNSFHEKLDGIGLYNLYGPTEAAIDVSCWPAVKQDEAVTVVPIGKPVSNTQLYILDAAGNVVPLGVTGELYIGGIQVARGYLNRAELTAEKFVSAPWNAAERLYRTGDLACWLPDGNIAYQGRTDDQVKIRGYRIELGEIEYAVQQHASVSQCVVLVKADKHGNKRLVGYVVPEGTFNKEALQEWLKDRLPEYMVPALWVPLEVIPLTGNGKTDRKALPEPSDAGAAENTYVMPRNDAEYALAAIWKELLGVQRVGIYDNFFELGGNSLLAMRLIAAIRKSMQLEVAVGSIFKHPDIAGLSALLHLYEPTAVPAIKALPRPERIPLSFSQQRLWFIDQLEGSVHYHIPALLKLSGPLHREALELALREVVQRHEVLRTVMVEEEGKAWQQVRTADAWQLEQLSDREEMMTWLDKPFILAEDYMLRAGLLQEGKDEYLLAIVMHHIASDGWSMGVIVKELPELYEAITTGRIPALAAPELQYADYALWQRDYLSGTVLSAQLEYWKDQLTGVAPLNLLTDYPRPAIQSNAGNKVTYHIPAVLQASLQSLSHEQGVTLYMTLLAAFQVLLYRYSGQEDICVGTPVAGRRLQELENMIGFFVNTLAVRQQVDGDSAFTALLQSLKQQLLAAYEHQDLPFEKMVEAVSPERDRSRHPLFQVMFILQNQETSDATRLGDVLLSQETIAHNISKFDLTFGLSEQADGLAMEIEYSTALFHEDTIRRMAGHYERLLQSIVSAPETKTGLLRLITEEEVTSVVNDFNDTVVACNQEQTFVDLFREQALRTPDAPAVIYENEVLSYRELDERSGQLAHYLRQQGVQDEAYVPLFLERSPDMIISILGIMKAGGAYVPIDPQYPESRIRFMLEDTGAALVITHRRLGAVLSGIFSGTILSLDEQKNAIAAAPVEVLSSTPHPGQLVYLIYTSGSTGKPKGVMVEHAGMLNHLYAKVNDLQLNSNSIVAYTASYTFDISVWQMFSAFLCGGATVVYTEHLIFSPAQLMTDVDQRKVTILELVPSYLSSVLQEEIPVALQSLQYLLVTGEAVSQHLVSQWFSKYPAIPVVNAYGPTEASDDICHHIMHTTPTGITVPLGKPVQNLQLYVVDAAMQVNPVGVPGEICVSGIGVSRGYLNRPDLTAEKFIANPFPSGGRLYRTGDLGRWLPDGTMEYLGRIDDQVKIRGFRIELGEIEHTIQQHASVNQCVVLVKADKHGNKRLVGYVVPEGVFNKDEVQLWLKDRLPEYMAPALWVPLEEIPLTNNGKIDRKALPEPADTGATQHNYVAPRNEAEHALANIWKELLGIQQVGIHDNFFELGGDSIITIQVVSRARRAGYELKPVDLFKHQTIAGLSALLAASGQHADVHTEQGVLTGDSNLLPIQQAFFDNVAPDGNDAAGTHYNQSVLLRISRQVNTTVATDAIQHLISHHDALRFTYQYDQGWKQAYGDHYEHIEIVDFRAVAAEDLDNMIASYSNKYQQSLSPQHGIVIRAVLMLMPGYKEDNRLLIIIHHLAVDGVSWRILLEDLEMLLKNNQQQTPEAILGPKTSSYRQWYNALAVHAQRRDVQAQLPYWEQAVQHHHPLRTTKQHTAAITVSDIRNLTVKLDTALTGQLLYNTAQAYHTEINDLLLCALAFTLAAWNGDKQVLIGLESHGREHISDHMDVTRTVGWFTGLFPVLLSAGADLPERDMLKSVKEQLRRIPGKGLGYGMLKYINRAATLQQAAGWDVIFNYLGQAGNVINKDGLLGAAEEPGGDAVGLNFPVNEKLTVDSIIQDGQLVLQWKYSAVHFDHTDIEQLANDYLLRLRALIKHCFAQEVSQYTPSDYALEQEISYTELDAFLDAGHNGSPRREQIDSLYRLSGLQESMLFHGLYDNQSAAYMEQVSCDITDLREDIFRDTWAVILRHHAILRSAFYYDTFSIPVQCVYKETAIPVTIKDFSGMTKDRQEAAVKAFEATDRTTGFDFREHPLMRLTLIRLDDRRCRLVWTIHHLLIDGWSMPVILEELLHTYELLATGQEVPQQQEDRFEPHIRYLEARDKEQEEAYWRQYLKDVTENTLLPFVQAADDAAGNDGIFREEIKPFGKAFSDKIIRYAQQQRLTVNTLIQGIWAYLLHYYTGNEHITYGVTVSGRPEELPGIEQAVGMYINTLPFRSGINKHAAVTDWLQQLQLEQLQSRRFQYATLEEIQLWAGLRGELFNTLLVFENYPVNAIIASNNWQLQVEQVVISEQTNFPLEVIVGVADEITVIFKYNDSVLSTSAVKVIAGHFEQLLSQITLQSHLTIGDLNPLTAAEQTLLLETFNAKQVAYPHEKNVVTIFEEQVKARPDAVALVYESRTMTYRDVDEAANRIAHLLQHHNVHADTLVGICLEKGLNMLLGILGVWKAGGAYIPFDPAYPAERMRYMLSDTGTNIILSSDQSKGNIPQDWSGLIINLDDAAALADYPATSLSYQPAAGDLSYVIYTSGSTGKPKGVLVEHAGMLNHLYAKINDLEMNEATILAYTASYTFDISVWQMFSALLCGGRTVIYGDHHILHPSALIKQVEDDQVNILELVPSYLAAVLQENPSVTLSCLRYLLVTGGR